LRTALGMCLLGIFLLAITWRIAAEASPAHGYASLALTFVLCAIGGAMLSMKRSVTSGICQGIDKLDLGPKGLDLVFSRLLEIRDEAQHGERGTEHAQLAENLPLEQADDLLTEAVTRVLKAPVEGGGPGGFLRRKILSVLVRKIELVTLAEFRVADQSAGGVNLIMVRDRLGNEIDGLLMKITKSASRKTTTIFVSGILVACMVGTWGITQLNF